MPQVLERPQVKEVVEPQGFEPSWGEEAHGIIVRNNPLKQIDPSGKVTVPSAPPDQQIQYMACFDQFSTCLIKAWAPFGLLDLAQGLANYFAMGWQANVVGQACDLKQPLKSSIVRDAIWERDSFLKLGKYIGWLAIANGILETEDCYQSFISCNNKINKKKCNGGSCKAD